MKKYNKNKNKFDLGKVAGGLSLGGGISSGGKLSLLDDSKDITKDEKTGSITTKDTTVGIYIDTSIK